MKHKTIAVIVRLYLVAALAASFSHIITSAHKLGLDGWEAWSAPFIIDGIAIMGMVMRGNEFSARTRKIGFRVQLGMGLASLAANVYAADSIGGIIFGVAVVAVFVLAEWLSDNMESAQAEQARLAAIEAAERKAAGVAKRCATLAAKTKTTKAQQPKRTTRKPALAAA
jgi:uncharacterized protein DUF2637